MRHGFELSDQQLFGQIASGSEKALRVIYQRYFNRLYLFVIKILKHEELAKEVVQDVFIKLWLGRDVLHNVDVPEAYLFTLARHKAIDSLRKLIKESTIEIDLEQKILLSPHEADQKVQLADLKDLIVKALSRLSQQKQKVFQLSRYEHYSHDQIAEELNLSKSTVKNHLSETLTYLREQLNQTTENKGFI